MKRGHEEEHTLTEITKDYSLFQKCLQETSFTFDEYDNIIKFCQKQKEEIEKTKYKNKLTTVLSEFSIEKFYDELSEIESDVTEGKANEELNNEILDFIKHLTVISASNTEKFDVYRHVTFSIGVNYNNSKTLHFEFTVKRCGGAGDYYFQDYEVNGRPVSSYNNEIEFILKEIKLSSQVTRAVFIDILDYLFQNTFDKWYEYSFGWKND